MSDSRVVEFLLGAVIMSSLVLFGFGLDPEGWKVKLLQLPVVIAQVFFICMVFYCIGFKRLAAIFSVPQRILLLALFLYVPVISFTSRTPTADDFAHFWMIHILFFVAACGFFRMRDVSSIGWVWILIGVTGLIHVVAFVFALIVWPDEVRNMLLPAFANIRNLGYLLSPAAAVMAVLFVTRQGPGIIVIPCYFSAAFYLIYTGSRGGAGGATGSLLIVSIYLWWHQQSVSPKRIAALATLTVGCIIVAELLPHLPWRPIFSRSVELASMLGTEAQSPRVTMWVWAWQAFLENWAFGYGPALLREIPEYAGTRFRHPHNIVLQLLLHWGIIGTSIIVALLLTFVRQIWTVMKKYPTTTSAPLAVLLAMLIHALVEAGLYYPFSTAIAIIGFAALVGAAKDDDEYENRNS